MLLFDPKTFTLLSCRHFVYLFFHFFCFQILNVNDRATAIYLNHSSVLENSPPGTVIGTLSTADEDKGQNHVYTVLPFGNVTDACKFGTRPLASFSCKFISITGKMNGPFVLTNVSFLLNECTNIP